MNAYERFFARLAGKPVDRAPNHCIIMGFGANYIGKTYREFATDYRVLSQAAIRCREDFDLDILSAISDPVRETAGFGAVMEYPENAVPYCPEPLLQQLSDISKLHVFDPSTQERTHDRLMAVRTMAEHAQKDCPVQGWVEGAFAEACDLRGVSTMLMDLVDEPEAVEELLEITTQEAILFAQQQIDAGADIIGIGDAAASLIGPAFYREFVLPYEIRLIQAVHDKGAIAKLHICGNINPLLDSLVETGADMIDCDWMVDWRRASETFGTKIAPCGNFDPVRVVMQGSVEDVKRAVADCVAADSYQRSIIAAGCEIPVNTPYENLKAVSAALNDL